MRTVLIIDPDANFRRDAYRVLLVAGWRVLEAEEGEAGVAQAMRHQPDAIICDQRAPRFNGFQVCRNIRSQRNRIKQPIIIVVSSSSYPSDRHSAIESGADKYLVKPFPPDELVRLLDGKSLYDTDVIARAEVEARPEPTAIPAEGPTLIRFWGVRGSIPTPGPSTVLYGGNTTCVEVRADGEIIVLDAGSGIRGLGLTLAREFQDRPIDVTLLITHTHWDHIQGFPFFVPAYNPMNKVRILGYEGARRGLLQTLSTQMESPYFPVSMRQMPSNIDVKELRETEFYIGKVKVQSIFVNHPGVCVGYRLFTSCGSIVFIPDHEPYQRMRLYSGGSQPTDLKEIQQHASEQDQKLVEFLQEADVLIMDSQYDDQEYQKRAGWGHGCVDDAVAMALLARIKQLFLFHHDPDHDDAQITRMLAWARELVAMQGETLPVDVAREGFEYVLTPPRPMEQSVPPPV
jgi:phosphoribosyl 1,2-cyclic phosphodiesterase/ActR/RegA family two-component response regulator